MTEVSQSTSPTAIGKDGCDPRPPRYSALYAANQTRSIVGTEIQRRPAPTAPSNTELSPYMKYMQDHYYNPGTQLCGSGWSGSFDGHGGGFDAGNSGGDGGCGGDGGGGGGD